jgi:hypothetical protein
MNVLLAMALSGGLFAVFTFIHFFVDWICQTHAEAMAKHNNPWVRARHCLIYTLGFVPSMYVLGFDFWSWVIGLNVLFWSHFVEDTYVPVFLWAKHIRKPAEMQAPNDPKKGFIEFISTPLGKILMIAVDQIIHLTFLWVLVWLALRGK